MLRFLPLALLCALWTGPSSPSAPIHLRLIPSIHNAVLSHPSSPPALQNGKPSKADDLSKRDDHKAIPPADIHNPVLWHDPGNIAAKNLTYGQGGKDGQPKPPFIFLDEKKHDSNPKFDVRDANGREWRVKLGVEARPEIVASRLLWAVGYYTEDDYVLPVATVKGLHLHRGRHFIHNGDQVINAQFARKPHHEHRIAAWLWKKNPFSGTREFNGLRVMMALMNSWDLKTENNAVYSAKGDKRQVFLVSDLGATFGTNSLRIKNVNCKGNVDKYVKSKFITHVTPTEVSFGTPAPPNVVVFETLGLLTPMYFRRKGYDWIGDHIPRKDAHWIGTLLSQLTHQQLVDAFRAGQFTPEETSQYVTVVEKRIAQLKAL